MYPTTTPVQFDPPALRASVERMLAERPERMYLTHYGMLEGRIPEAAAAMLSAVDGHVAVARGRRPGRGARRPSGPAWRSSCSACSAHRGWKGTREEALEAFAADLDLNSQGLEVWMAGQSR